MNQIEQNDAPNAELDGDEYRQVPFTGRVENPGVLEKNSDLDKDIEWSVEDNDSVIPLAWWLVNRSKVDTNRPVSYVKQSEEGA